MVTEEGNDNICEALYITQRMVDFIEESMYKVSEDMDRAFHDRVKLVKEGTLAPEDYLRAQLLGDISHASIILS